MSNGNAYSCAVCPLTHPAHLVEAKGPRPAWMTRWIVIKHPTGDREEIALCSKDCARRYFEGDTPA